MTTAAWRVIGLFFLHAVAGGAIYARIPDIQTALGLTPSQLGLALMGQPVGALSMFLFSATIIERFDPRRIALVALPLLIISLGFAASAPHAWVLFAAMALYGATFSLVNVAMNVEADRVEAASGRRIMNRCHGIWSLGFLGASLLGTLARGLAISPTLHLWGLVPLILLGVAIVVYPMQPAPHRPHTGTAKRSRFSIPTLATLGLVGFGLASGVLEGAVRTWSVIFMRDSFDAAAWVQTLTLPAMLSAMVVGRLLADRVIDRFGPVRVALTLTAIAMAGLALVVVSPGVLVALLGFAVIGIGNCVAFPLMVSAAARLGDRPASDNVAATTLIMQLSGLVSPPVLGWVAQTFGLRTTFAMLLPLLVLSLALAHKLSPRTAVVADPTIA